MLTATATAQVWNDLVGSMDWANDPGTAVEAIILRIKAATHGAESYTAVSLSLTDREFILLSEPITDMGWADEFTVDQDGEPIRFIPIRPYGSV